MSTASQIAANQANAQLSTGPKTETGKAASSQNSWKHGLTFGVFHVLNTESQMQYQDLLEQLLAEYHPATPTEAILVERMAQHHWLRNRALHFQNQYLESGDESSAKQLSLFMRYESMHERAFHKCLNDLLKLRAERQKQEIGFASQAHKERMRELDVLCREQDVRYREIRTAGAETHLEFKEMHNNPKNQEPALQKAA